MGEEAHADQVLPILDFSEGLVLKQGTEEWKAMNNKVREACENYGCFLLLVKDEIPMNLREEMVAAMKALFDLPEETKQKHTSPKPYQSYEGKSPVIPLNESFGIDNACELDAAEAFTNLMWPQGKPSFCVVPHGGVILFGETANLKPDFLKTCYNLLSGEYGNIPIVLCSNKADVNHVMMMGDKNITLPHFEISANNDHNLEAPFLYLAKKPTEKKELLSVKPQPPVASPPPMQMDMTAAQHGPESGPAAAQPGPVEDNNGCCSACLKPLVACLKACYYLVSIWDICMKWLEEA